MTEHIITRQMLDQTKAIKMCIYAQLIMPAITLIYSGIDVAASIGRPEGQLEVAKRDFVTWAEEHMACKTSLGVSGLDLYAARCGVLHSSTAESNLWRRNQAIRIFYAWGNARVEEESATIGKLGKSERLIHVDTLFDAFTSGLADFIVSVDKDEERKALALSRASSMFANVPELLPT